MKVSPPAFRGNGAFRVGEWVAQPGLNQLSRGEITLRLRPKVMDVLAHLAARPGEVISKEEILDAVWSKQFLGDTALSRAVFELREALGDDPQNPTYIETIPKRGYRIIASVAPLDSSPERGTPPAGDRMHFWTSRTTQVTAVLAVVLLAGLAGLGRLGLLRPRNVPVRQTKIVVLPFENLGAPGDAYFAAGITDEVTGRLVSVQGISVISKNSAEHYAGSKMSQTDVGRDLGVDFVLGGAIRWERGNPGPSRVRITPRLVRVADDTQVWADVYDRVLEDLFSVQSEIARSVIAEIGTVVQPPAGKELDRRPTANVEAYQAFLRGKYYADNFYRSEQDLRLGLSMYERAVELDPAFAVAWGEIARVRAGLYHLGSDRSESSRAEAKRALDHALSLDAASARIRYDAGLFHYWYYRDYRRALNEFSLARKAGGDSADLRVAESYLLRRQGRWEEALRSLRAAKELDPRGWTIFRELGLNSLFLHHYEDAERYLKKAIALAPDEPESYEFLAEAYWAGGGDLNAARAILKAMPRSLEPRPTRWRFWQDVYEGDVQAGLSRLLTASFDVIDDSEVWESRRVLLGRAYWFLGRTDAARQEFEQARSELERVLAQRPDDFSLHSALGLCLAGLGRKEEAIREGRRATELVRLRNDVVATPATTYRLAEIFAMAGEPDMACAQLDTVLAMPSRASVALVQLDPTWAPLRSSPCYAALIAKHQSKKAESRGRGSA